MRPRPHRGGHGGLPRLRGFHPQQISLCCIILQGSGIEKFSSGGTAYGRLYRGDPVSVSTTPGSVCGTIASSPGERVRHRRSFRERNLPDLETENETGILPEPLNDDERLEALIARTSVPLLELAAGEVYSAHIQDDAALRDRAADICSLAGSARLDASALDVSPGVASAHADFIAALDEFIAAGTLL